MAKRRSQVSHSALTDLPGSGSEGPTPSICQFSKQMDQWQSGDESGTNK